MLLTKIRQLWHPDIAIDLGTATTRVAVAHRKYQFDTPSTPLTGVGASAAARPALAKGVVVDVEAAAEALRPVLYRLRQKGLSQPRALACAPTDASATEREAVIEVCRRAGVAAVALMPEPAAAALGDGVDQDSHALTLLMDIGDGVTDCAVIRQGRLVEANACRIGCADLRAAVRAAVERWGGARLSDAEATALIAEAGLPLAPSAARRGAGPEGMPPLRFVSVPNALRTGAMALPVGVVHEALRPVLGQITMSLLSLIWMAPWVRRELTGTGDAVRLSGGGALIPGIAAHVSEAASLPVRVVRSPLASVVQGAKRVLPMAAEHDLWRQVAGER